MPSIFIAGPLISVPQTRSSRPRQRRSTHPHPQPKPRIASCPSSGAPGAHQGSTDAFLCYTASFEEPPDFRSARHAYAEIRCWERHASSAVSVLYRTQCLYKFQRARCGNEQT